MVRIKASFSQGKTASIRKHALLTTTRLYIIETHFIAVSTVWDIFMGVIRLRAVEKHL